MNPILEEHTKITNIEVFLNFDVYARIIYKLFQGTISTYLFHSLDQICLHHKVLTFSKKFYLRGGMENDLGRGWYRIPVKRIIPFFKIYKLELKIPVHISQYRFSLFQLTCTSPGSS